MVFFGLVAFSHDRKFLGSIGHDQMLKVVFLIFLKMIGVDSAAVLIFATFILGTNFYIVSHYLVILVWLVRKVLGQKMREVS